MKSSIQKYKDPAGHRKRLRDLFLRSGREGFPDYELLELLLTYSLPRIDTKPIAKALLHKFGSVVNVFQQPNERLQEVSGVGPKTITFFRVFQDCLIRCTEVQVENQRSISGPEDLSAFVGIKYIAGYQTAPISAITYFAEVARIEKYKNTGKYIVYFKNRASKLGPVKLSGKDKGLAPQAPRYTTFRRLKSAKTIGDVF